MGLSASLHWGMFHEAAVAAWEMQGEDGTRAQAQESWDQSGHTNRRESMVTLRCPPRTGAEDL